MSPSSRSRLRRRKSKGLDPARSLPDSFRVSGQEIYLHLPHGVADSKLTNAWFDSKLSIFPRQENWATVLRLVSNGGTAIVIIVSPILSAGAYNWGVKKLIPKIDTDFAGNSSTSSNTTFRNSG